MFYVVELRKELEIQPRFFGPRLTEEIERRLRQEMEGTCHEKYGFVLVVMGLVSRGRGVIREGAGSATFDVTYQCACQLPSKGDVIDARVESVNKMGFFCSAGSLTVFVSNHLIPDDMEFSTTHEPAYVSADGEVTVKAGLFVRLRIVGTRVDAANIFAVGTIKEDYLGVMNQ